MIHGNQVSVRFLGPLGLQGPGKESAGVGGRVWGRAGRLGCGEMGFLPPGPMADWRVGVSATLAGIWAQMGLALREALVRALLSSGLCLRPAKVEVPTSD